MSLESPEMLASPSKSRLDFVRNVKDNIAVTCRFYRQKGQYMDPDSWHGHDRKMMGRCSSKWSAPKVQVCRDWHLSIFFKVLFGVIIQLIV